MFKRFVNSESGAAMVEYGLLVGLITVVCIVAVTQLGHNISAVFCAINTKISEIPALAGLGGVGTAGCAAAPAG
jgi:pilus assembly protein Flp/PilA